MLGLYDRTPDRKKIVLDGWWSFCTDPDDQGIDQDYVAQFPSTRRISVPGCWNTEFGLHGYEGAGWYQKTFDSTFTGPALLTFGAVADICQVWLNGESIGEHDGGHTAFSFVVDLAEGPNTLVVRADNRHDETTLPKDAVDWFPYGGITRSVICEQIGTAYIRTIHVRGGIDGQVNVRVFVENLGDSEVTLPLSLEVDGQTYDEQNLTIAPSSRQGAALEAQVSDPTLWSTEDPHLYTATVRLGEDSYQSKFGLREIATDGANLLLNGEKIWIRGVNRHEDHPDWGFALPAKLMQRDVEIIQDLHCNAVRGSHYPNHPTFLDMCDETGLLCFAEVPGWQYSAAQIAHSPTKEKLQQTLREMIWEQFNHPSIVFWSMHNECQTDVDVQPGIDLSAAMAELIGLARSLDETRLITYASMKFWNDKHFDLVDVICLNEYIGWYVEAIDGADFPEYLRRMAEMIPDKPILITEFGAGGISGYHSLDAFKWSEEYQVHQLRTQIEAMRENDHVAGCYIWQYCDIVTHPRRAMGRPRSMNNKGLVNEWRQPKSAYFAVRDLFARIKDE